MTAPTPTPAPNDVQPAQVNVVPPNAPPAATTPPAEPPTETDWKAEARKWEQRAKENTAAAQRLAEIEESQKTEAEKLAARTAAAEKRAADLELRATRAEVAAAKSVPADLLTGSTQAEIEASADALIAFKGVQPADDGAGKKTYIIPDEGGIPALGKDQTFAPGIGTLRAGYAQIATERK